MLCCGLSVCGICDLPLSVCILRVYEVAWEKICCLESLNDEFCSEIKVLINVSTSNDMIGRIAGWGKRASIQ